MALELARREDVRVSICVQTLYNYIESDLFVELTNAHPLEKTKRNRVAGGRLQLGPNGLNKLVCAQRRNTDPLRGRSHWTKSENVNKVKEESKEDIPPIVSREIFNLCAVYAGEDAKLLDAVLNQLTCAVSTGMETVIPPKRDRKEQREYDRYLYKLPRLVENCFLILKRWRGIAARS